MHSSIFFAPDISIALQVVLLALFVGVYGMLILRGLKKPRYLFISIFYFFNFIFVVPYFFSISSGSFGYAARMAAVPTTDYFVLTLYLIQIILPVIVLEATARLFKFSSINVSYRWKQGAFLNGLIASTLALYLMVFFLKENSPLLLALQGDIEGALGGRVSIRVGGGGEAFGFIYKFHRLFSQYALIWLAFYIISSNHVRKIFLLPIFFLAGFSDFSKGGLAFAIMFLSLSLFISFVSSNKGYNALKALRFLSLGAFAALGALVVYVRTFAAVDYASAGRFIGRRFYNHTSSVFGQIEMYADRSPLIWSVADFGAITRWAAIETFVPKAEIYPIIFGRDGGQAGSMMSSELFFFSGSTFPVLMVFILTILGAVMMAMNSAALNLNVSKKGNKLFIPFAVYVGVWLPMYALWQPFKVFSVFTLLRLEIILTLVILLTFFKFSMSRAKF